MRRREKPVPETKPLSEFGANATELIEQMKNSGRPLVLTLKGHSAAVVLDVAEYERMVEEIEFLSDVRTALEQIQAGQAVSNADAKAQLRSRFSR